MKRRAAKVILLLLLGAIINVAVAWTIALWKPIVSAPSAAQNYRVTSDEVALWAESAPKDLSPNPLLSSRVSTWTLTARYLAANRTDALITVTTDAAGVLTGLRAEASSSPYLFDFGLFVSAGLPLQSLEGARFVRANGQRNQFHLAATMMIDPKPGSATVIHAIAMDRSTANGREYRILPTRILPIGFAINTISYAAIAWMLFAVPGPGRRRRRIKRGLCPACAYPVGDSAVCTECGTPT